ncbi:hypothetical protein B0H14DRAFT_3539118 [Mycena olivaceomarginata]|nr:hypothetical protein B0H14DRAFT_3539118 [Mycena olivaceomarginata]
MPRVKLDEEERKARRRESSRKYDARHTEQRNAKTRERMARLRASEDTRPKEEQIARRAARHAADQRHRGRLAADARYARQVVAKAKADHKATILLKQRARDARRGARAQDRAWAAVRDVLLEGEPEDDHDHDGGGSEDGGNIPCA